MGRHGVEPGEDADGGTGVLPSGIDEAALPGLPDLILGRAEHRRDERQVSCVLNHVGPGCQIAARGAALSRKTAAGAYHGPTADG